MTHIPRRLSASIGIPKGNHTDDISLAQMDDELEEHLAHSTSSLLPLVGLLRKQSISLPREISPRRLLGVGLGFAALSIHPKLKLKPRIAAGVIGLSATTLAWDVKRLEETEQEDRILLKPGTPSNESPISSGDWANASTLLACISVMGDTIGLDHKRKAAAMAGSVATAAIGVYVSMFEEIDEAALDLAQTGVW